MYVQNVYLDKRQQGDTTMYEITITDLESNYTPFPVFTMDFKSTHETLKEAKKAVRALIKKHNLQRHSGRVINYNTRLELLTSF